jgi:hypothetical protein
MRRPRLSAILRTVSAGYRSGNAASLLIPREIAAIAL